MTGRSGNLIRTIALVAVAVTSANASAALSTYAPWEAAYTGNGLNGVLFNVQSAGDVTVALGAHAYKNGVNMVSNNGVDTFEGMKGIFLPDGKGRANWSFDFGWQLGANCQGCKVTLGIDKDFSAGVDFAYLDLTNFLPNPESWNMEMGFLGPLGFDPFSKSSTAFTLFVNDALGAELARTDITVNVPEPGTLALMGMALAGIAGLRRRRS